MTTIPACSVNAFSIDVIISLLESFELCNTIGVWMDFTCESVISSNLESVT